MAKPNYVELSLKMLSAVIEYWCFLWWWLSKLMHLYKPQCVTYSIVLHWCCLTASISNSWVCINNTCWFLTSAQFRSTGHVLRMNDDRLPKVIFYSKLKDGTRSRGGQRKCYKDLFKVNMKWCDMVRNDLEALALNRVMLQECSSPIWSQSCLDHRDQECSQEDGDTLDGWQFSVWCLRTTMCIQDHLICTQMNSLSLRSVLSTAHSTQLHMLPTTHTGRSNTQVCGCPADVWRST